VKLFLISDTRQIIFWFLFIGSNRSREQLNIFLMVKIYIFLLSTGSKWIIDFNVDTREIVRT